MPFATRQLAFLATIIAFNKILTRARAEIKILRKWPTSLGFFDFGIFFFRLFFFSFSFLFSAVIDLLLGLLAVKKRLRKRHRDGQFLPWSSQVWWQEIFVWVFLSTFWAFLSISHALFGRSLWSGHHWKNRFFPADFSFLQNQFWSNVTTSEVEERPRFVTAGYGRHRSQWVKEAWNPYLVKWFVRTTIFYRDCFNKHGVSPRFRLFDQVDQDQV